MQLYIVYFGYYYVSMYMYRAFGYISFHPKTIHLGGFDTRICYHSQYPYGHTWAPTAYNYQTRTKGIVEHFGAFSVFYLTP